jgi:polysaccharide biosynthesis protein PslH
MSALPSLLYVSPVVPARSGNGLAMRAGAVLRALARHYAVTLLVETRYGRGREPIPDEVRRCCLRVVHAGETWALSEGERFDVVHVFRLAALAAAAPWLERAGERWLDLDDLESVSRRAIASVHERRGESDRARRQRTVAEWAWRKEDETLRWFDRVFVCSDEDRRALESRPGRRAAIAILPNTLPLPETSLPPPPLDGPWTLLFVGTLSYAPNVDAVELAATEIVPRVQRQAKRPVRLLIVGTGAGPEVLRLGARPGVEVIGEVADVAPWYRAAHVAIVPIRAGGGTRIKILEAFAWRRPVVATAAGIAGIAAVPERHALVADDPDAFAAACLQLLRDSSLAARMADEAFALFLRDYSDDRLAALLAPTRSGQGEA